MDYKMKTKKQYDLLVLDPAWKYTASAKMHAQVGAIYKTSKPKDWYDWDIRGLCHKHSQVWIWTNAAKTNECLKLAAAWGLVYTGSKFYWKKHTRKLMSPMYFMNQVEEVMCFRPKRAKTWPFKKKTNPGNFLDSKPGKHSAKPEQFQDLLEGMYGTPSELAYCELFARRYRPGWDCVGNELNGTIEDFLAGVPMKLQ
jgi:N6-adenosine-specific RNA methylase IME4